MRHRNESTDSTDLSYSETTNTADTLTLNSCSPDTLTVYLANSATSYILSSTVGLDLVLQASTSTLTLTIEQAADFNGGGAAVIVGTTTFSLPYTFKAVATDTTLAIFYTFESKIPWDPLIKVIPPRPRPTPSESRVAGRSSS